MGRGLSIPQIFGTSYRRAHSMRKMAKFCMLIKGNFTGVTTQPVLAKNVCDTNADARDQFAVLRDIYIFAAFAKRMLFHFLLSLIYLFIYYYYYYYYYYPRHRHRLLTSYSTINCSRLHILQNVKLRYHALTISYIPASSVCRINTHMGGPVDRSTFIDACVWQQTRGRSSVSSVVHSAAAS